MGSENLDPAHQDVEQALAGRFARHVDVDAVEHLAVDVLDEGGEDRELGAELAAQFRERDLGAGGDFGIADVLDGPCRQDGHEGGDDPITLRRPGPALRRRDRGRRGAASGP